MPVESAQFINTLTPEWPLGTDPESAGDDHIRMVKQVLQNTFPNFTSQLTPSADDINGVIPHLSYSTGADFDASEPGVMTLWNPTHDGAAWLIARGAGNAAEMAQNPSYAMTGVTLMNVIFPVGSVIFNTGINPASYMGFGTWTQRSGVIYGAGGVFDKTEGTYEYIFGNGQVAGNLLVQEAHMWPQQHSWQLAIDAVGDHAHQAGVGAPGAKWEDYNVGTDNQGNFTATYTGNAGGHGHTGSVSASFGLATDFMMTPGWCFTVWERTA